MRRLVPFLLAVSVVAGPSAVHAQDNIDPLDQGSQHAWGENVGWLNAEPKPPGGALPGVVVSDGGLTGYGWLENAGWVSFSCQNTGSCGTVAYGVVNDGTGTLSGFAWGENIGWIDFRPSIGGVPVPGAGVAIDPASGIFSGFAWAENVGWISFGFSTPGLGVYQVRTSWRGSTDLAVTKTDGQTTAVPGQPVTYTIVAANGGPSPVVGATVSDTLPSVLIGATWTCTASPGSSCTASGAGSIADSVSLVVGGSATYTLTATVDAAATGSLVNTASVAAPAGGSDPNAANDSATDTDTLTVDLAAEGELVHGTTLWTDLQSLGGVPDQDLYRIGQAPRSSYEVVVDGTSGDVGTGQGPELARLASDGAVIQSAVAAGAGASRSLRWENRTAGPVNDEYVRVRSAGCTTGCDAQDVYRIRSYDTTLRVPRFNNSGSQITVLVVQNTSDAILAGHAYFWSTTGTPLGSQAFTIDPRGAFVVNTSGVPGVAGQGGTITLSHDGPYGTVMGKAVAVEPATGFTFDTPLEPRRR